MLFIDSDSVGDQDVELVSTSAAVAIADTVTAAIPAERKRGGCNAGKPTGNINKVPKEDSITAIVSGDGGRASEAA
jgi:hypothetical protein